MPGETVWRGQRRRRAACGTKRRHLLWLSLSLLGALWGAEAAMAQTASAVTPESFAPPRQAATRPVTLSGPATAPIPAGADRLFVTLGDVVVADGYPAMALAADKLRAALTGRTVSAAEIFRAAAALEADYAKAGFVLARVNLPPQTLRNGGTLRLEVINGFVEKVDQTGVADPVRTRINELTGGLVERRSVTLRELERALLLAGDTYGVALGSTLSAGQQPGGTQLILDTRFKPIVAFAGIDTNLAEDLGGLNLNAGISFNGLLKRGETFYLRASGSPDQAFAARPQYRALAGGVVLPLGKQGMTLNLEATNSRSTPDSDALPTTSDFTRYSARLYYPWIRSRALNFSGQLSFDWQHDRQWLLAGGGRIGLYEDQLSVLRLALNGDRTFDDGSLVQGGLILSKGLDLFGARRAADAGGLLPLSRDGADAVFTKLTVGGSYRRPLPGDWAMELTARMQTSFGDPLLTSEQMSLTGPKELSSFETGAVRGDSGAVIRAEISAPSRQIGGPVPFQLTPYVFGAYGVANLENPTVVEAGTVRASALGLGLSMDLMTGDGKPGGTARLEYGRGQRNDDEPAGNRFSLVATLRF